MELDAIVQEDMDWLIDNIDVQSFDNSKILITGASGAIARYLVYFFMELQIKHDIECEVHALVRNNEKAEKIFRNWLHESHFYLHAGSIEDNGALAKGMTYIFHAAGISATNMFELCPVDVIKANVMGTEGLLNASIGNEKLKKMVFFSSGAVYGEVPDVTEPVNEDVYYPLNPFGTAGCYAEGKRMGEVLCYSYWKQYRIPTAMVRIGHSYGPGIDLQSGHVYSDFIRALIEGNDITIKNPDVFRPFTYVRDTIYGILILALKAKEGQAYNLWNVKGEIPIGKLADVLCYKVFKEKNLKVYLDNKEYFYHDKYNETIITHRNDTKKIEALGWKACVDIEQGFLRTVKSFQLNQ